MKKNRVQTVFDEIEPLLKASIQVRDDDFVLSAYAAYRAAEQLYKNVSEDFIENRAISLDEQSTLKKLCIKVIALEIIEFGCIKFRWEDFFKMLDKIWDSACEHSQSDTHLISRTG